MKNYSRTFKQFLLTGTIMASAFMAHADENTAENTASPQAVTQSVNAPNWFERNIGNPVADFVTEDVPNFFTEDIPAAAQYVGESVGIVSPEPTVEMTLPENTQPQPENPNWFERNIGNPVTNFVTEDIPHFAKRDVPNFVTEDVPNFFTEDIPAAAQYVGEGLGIVDERVNPTRPNEVPNDTANTATNAPATQQAPAQTATPETGFWDNVGSFFTDDVPNFFTEDVPNFFTEDIPAAAQYVGEGLGLVDSDENVEQLTPTDLPSDGPIEPEIEQENIQQTQPAPQPQQTIQMERPAPLVQQPTQQFTRFGNLTPIWNNPNAFARIVPPMSTPEMMNTAHRANEFKTIENNTIGRDGVIVIIDEPAKTTQPEQQNVQTNTNEPAPQQTVQQTPTQTVADVIAENEQPAANTIDLGQFLTPEQVTAFTNRTADEMPLPPEQREREKVYARREEDELNRPKETDEETPHNTDDHTRTTTGVDYDSVFKKAAPQPNAAKGGKEPVKETAPDTLVITDAVNATQKTTEKKAEGQPAPSTMTVEMPHKTAETTKGETDKPANSFWIINEKSFADKSYLETYKTLRKPITRIAFADLDNNAYGTVEKYAAERKDDFKLDTVSITGHKAPDLKVPFNAKTVDLHTMDTKTLNRIQLEPTKQFELKLGTVAQSRIDFTTCGAIEDMTLSIKDATAVKSIVLPAQLKRLTLTTNNVELIDKLKKEYPNVIINVPDKEKKTAEKAAPQPKQAAAKTPQPKSVGTKEPVDLYVPETYGKPKKHVTFDEEYFAKKKRNTKLTSHGQTVDRLMKAAEKEEAARKKAVEELKKSAKAAKAAKTEKAKGTKTEAESSVFSIHITAKKKEPIVSIKLPENDKNVRLRQTLKENTATKRRELKSPDPQKAGTKPDVSIYIKYKRIKGKDNDK